MKLILIIFIGLAISAKADESLRDSRVKTDNFIVYSPSPELGFVVANEAEYLRKKIATEWTGSVLEKWGTPCLISLSLDKGRKPWAWTYHEQGRVTEIALEGSKKSILTHSLPHELTHAVLISYYGGDIPRWCDEGMAVSSESDCPKRLNGKWGEMPLRELFTVTEYPDDWQSFYGQSYSVTAYLVQRHRQGRKGFVDFVRLGCRIGWEKACEETFHIQLEDLDIDWKKWHSQKFGVLSESTVEE